MALEEILGETDRLRSRLPREDCISLSHGGKRGMRLRHRDGVKVPVRQRPRESQADADTQLGREK